MGQFNRNSKVRHNSAAAAVRRSRRASANRGDSLTYVNTLIVNSRNTWFVLLGVLAFVGITLAGVEHADFYGVNRNTDLPLVNVSVPTRHFFYVAPVITAAVYCYFHLYLIRLWDEIGHLTSATNDANLEKKIAPWLVIDAGLYVRRLRRPNDPQCGDLRAMESASALLNVLLAWGFGILVLAYGWWSSMPAREIEMTAISALTCGYSSILVMWSRMGGEVSKGRANIWRRSLRGLVGTVTLLAVMAISYSRTTEDVIRIPDWINPLGSHGNLPLVDLAPIDLRNADLTERPDGWLSFQSARKEFLAIWCSRARSTDCGKLTDTQEAEFEAEWMERRAASIATLKSPDLSGRDLREADLTGAFLVGATLEGADLSGASLNSAQLEGVNFEKEKLIESYLNEAHLEGSNMVLVDLSGASLEGAQMVGAALSNSNLEEADFRRANLANADFSAANGNLLLLQDANLTKANFENAKLRAVKLNGATLHNAVIVDASMQRATLDGVRLSGLVLSRTDLTAASINGAHLSQSFVFDVIFQNAELDFTLISGAVDKPILLESSTMSAASAQGTAARYVDLSKVRYDELSYFRNAFIDATVKLPEGFREAMKSPCQWVNSELNGAEFFGRWRGWVEASPYLDKDWKAIAPEEWRDVTSIPPDSDCAWKTDCHDAGPGASSVLGVPGMAPPQLCESPWFGGAPSGPIGGDFPI